MLAIPLVGRRINLPQARGAHVLLVQLESTVRMEPAVLPVPQPLLLRRNLLLLLLVRACRQQRDLQVDRVPVIPDIFLLWITIPLSVNCVIAGNIILMGFLVLTVV